MSTQAGLPDSVPENYANPNSQHHDPRSHNDDSLLDNLLILCFLHGKSASRSTLSNGLPLENDRLTLNIFPRTAARASLKARVVTRTLDKTPAISLPAVSLLDVGGTGVLLAWNDDGSARFMPSESEGGEICVDTATLEQNYAGKVIFAYLRHEFDLQAEALLPRTKSWFKDTLKLSRSLYMDMVLASLLINLITLGTPLFTMNVYDRAVSNQATVTLWVLVVGICLASAFDLILKMLRDICLDIAGKKSDLIISSTLLECIVGMEMKERPTHAGSFAQNIHEFQSLRDSLSSLILTTIIDLPFTLLLLAAIGIIGGALTRIPVLTSPIALLCSQALQKPVNTVVAKTMSLASEHQALLIETLSSLDAIRVNNAQSERQFQWEQTLGSLSRLELQVKTLSDLASSLTGWFQQISGVVMIVVGVYMVIDGKLSVSGLIACYMLNGRALMSLDQLTGLIARYQQAKLIIRSTEKMMSLTQEHRAGENPLKRGQLQGSIEFHDVDLSYPEQQNLSLHKINLTIQPGERIGIIGRSGSGESSLSRLIVDLYQPSAGNLLIDGIDPRRLGMNDLRHSIGYMPQDIQLFNGTLRDNLLCGACYVDDETMLRMAELAGVNEFARLHPDGYNLQVGERGSQLSGGQRQTVVLARALLLDPPLLLLDEPTSSVDNTSEEKIKRALAPCVTGKTLLLVTYRASMLSLVSRLIIVDKGRIIADGPRGVVMGALKKGQINASR